ncbi:MAG: hypothetical protein ACI9G1_004598 [Pirellulaceae bacterium]
MGILEVLVQFVLRLTFGMAISMGLTPPKLVTSGFYRVHLWVLLGCNTFAAMSIWSNQDAFTTKWLSGQSMFLSAVGISVLSFIGAGVWLYEKPRAGLVFLFAIGILSLLTAVFGSRWNADMLTITADVISGGFLLGIITTAMLLGHWYLNTPTMQLGPLQKLVILSGIAIVIRALVSGVGGFMVDATTVSSSFWIFLAFRWLAGILSTFVLVVLTWQTLKIPNTQSATGILYAGVILAFLGELTSQLLSVGSHYPL